MSGSPLSVIEIRLPKRHEKGPNTLAKYFQTVSNQVKVHVDPASYTLSLSGETIFEYIQMRDEFRPDLSLVP